MAVQTQSTESQRSENRGITRREENYPSSELNPFSMFRRLSDEMDRAFASTFGLTRHQGAVGVWSPAVEVREHDNMVEVTAELPGMTKDDVKVECTDEGIILEGEKRREREHDEGGLHTSERSFGRFYRVIPLSDGAAPEKAKAEFKNGILKVQVPLSEHKRKSRPIRAIPIS